MSSSAWVSKILDSIPAEYQPRDPSARNDLEKATEEKLRQLNVKIRVLQSNKFDSEQFRAAIVLEWMLRKKWHHFRAKLVPLEKLLGPIGMKKKNRAIVELQIMLGHYLDDIEKGSAPTRVDVSDLRTMGLETIRDLSIRLGSMLRDPGSAAKYAELLFSAIIDHMNRLDRHERMASLADMERNKKEFAAGCFYLSARTETVETRKGWANGHESEEENEERNITELDVIHECMLAENQALLIFKRVSELSEEVHVDETRAAKKRKKDNPKKKEESKIVAARRPHQGGQCFSRNVQKNQECSAFIPGESFKKWKTSVLSQAKASAKAAMYERGSLLDSRLSDGEILEYAAIEALDQYVF
uniref:Uncharacterized protein n=1 Tax=Odontella aurita TaxID=265563 RepID=A0A7S4I0X1_9STRA|mmetsp:Transcript_18287/g.52800  ORF Transcript_18287/g.52800 Transcript_18287/m.52800 type:complete len:358 (+) Transcript_18287:171-1244(+)